MLQLLLAPVAPLSWQPGCVYLSGFRTCTRLPRLHMRVRVLPPDDLSPEFQPEH